MVNFKPMLFIISLTSYAIAGPTNRQQVTQPEANSISVDSVDTCYNGNNNPGTKNNTRGSSDIHTLSTRSEVVQLKHMDLQPRGNCFSAPSGRGSGRNRNSGSSHELTRVERQANRQAHREANHRMHDHTYDGRRRTPEEYGEALRAARRRPNSLVVHHTTPEELNRGTRDSSGRSSRNHRNNRSSRNSNGGNGNRGSRGNTNRGSSSRRPRRST
ncbi:hypothetical protein B0O99DRAFT_633402 [Bisporella sp. PMI_857]|nr:hypothetical protein B0O99DRAFT_633402 [Bisporella sp. PMI_857]